MVHAGVYAGVLHYLKAIEAAGAKEAEARRGQDEGATRPRIRLFGEGEVRADGRKIHDMYLFRVKAPDASTGPWDYYELVATIPAAEAFRPLAEGGCPLVQ